MVWAVEHGALVLSIKNRLHVVIPDPIFFYEEGLLNGTVRHHIEIQMALRTFGNDF